jgi:hypothetical protein
MKQLSYLLLVACVVGLQTALHALVSWSAALAAPLLFVVWSVRRNPAKLRVWLWAVATTVASWAILLALNFAFAPNETARLLPVLGGFLKLPVAAAPVISLLFAAIVGALTGVAGIGFHRVFGRL